MKAKLATPGPPADRSAIWWLLWIPTVVLTLIILYFLYVVGSVALVPVHGSTDRVRGSTAAIINL